MQVLVVGAGPVGLTMASELARHGVRCRVVDKLAAPSGYCKAIGVTPRTLEVWEDMGVARPMIDAGLWLRGMRMITAGQQRDSVFDFPELPYGGLGIPQFTTERILAEHLARFGIGVDRGAMLTGLRDEGRSVEVELTHQDGHAEQAEFRYVIGCDGAHSAVRSAVEIDFSGDRFPMPFMLGDVTIDWDLPRGFTCFSVVPTQGGAPDFMVAIPLPDRNRYRVTMLASPEFLKSANGEYVQQRSPDYGIASERAGPSLEQLQAVADRLLPGAPRLSNLRWSSLFGISMRLAETYRVGNVFIAGDAAHIHPPTGGQGMNTGIQDAYNLAWKLAAVLRGGADARLLDSYDAERRAVGADVVERTKAASMTFGRERAARENRLADTQILVSYRDSPLVTEDLGADGIGLRPGDRAPDVLGLRQEKVGFPLRLFDVIRGTTHVLICVFSAQSIGGQAKELEEILFQIRTARQDHQLRMVVIISGAGELPDFPSMTVLRDEAAAFEAAYGASGVYLVRPDGYIAYRHPRLNATDARNALNRSLGIGRS
jgi:2-polyprenyl-6-methoxyphenol hydroxylase-like FAD-dependent oxidoreductase